MRLSGCMQVVGGGLFISRLIDRRRRRVHMPLGS